MKYIEAKEKGGAFYFCRPGTVASEQAGNVGIPSAGAGSRRLEYTGTSLGLEFRECYHRTEISAIGQESFLVLSFKSQILLTDEFCWTDKEF